MNVDARGVLVGMVLGDGYINTTNGKSELSVQHSLAQRDYCEHKAALVKKYLGGKFTLREYATGPGRAYRGVRFTASNKYFAQIKSWCYPGGVKTFSSRVLDMLTPEGIAVWYMDDGSARRNYNKEGWVSSVATDIATMCSKEECDVICEYFRDTYDIEWNVRFLKNRKESTSYIIQCNTANSHKFVDLIQPYVVESMLYKLAHVADLGSHECRAPVGKCAKCGEHIYDARCKGLCRRCYSRKYYREVARFRDGRLPNPSGFYIKDE